MSPQNSRLTSYLRRSGSSGVTQVSALTNCGIMRLSERIRELEAMGFEFHRERLDIRNRDGNICHPMKYVLTKEASSNG